MAERKDNDVEPLRRITPHACRHTFASLMPGSEADAAELLDTYLAARRKRRADSSLRKAS